MWEKVAIQELNTKKYFTKYLDYQLALEKPGKSDRYALLRKTNREVRVLRSTDCERPVIKHLLLVTERFAVVGKFDK